MIAVHAWFALEYLSSAQRPRIEYPSGMYISRDPSMTPAAHGRSGHQLCGPWAPIASGRRALGHPMYRPAFNKAASARLAVGSLAPRMPFLRAWCTRPELVLMPSRCIILYL